MGLDKFRIKKSWTTAEFSACAMPYFVDATLLVLLLRKQPYLDWFYHEIGCKFMSRAIFTHSPVTCKISSSSINVVIIRKY